MSNNIYDILARLPNLTEPTISVEETQPIVESVEATVAPSRREILAEKLAEAKQQARDSAKEQTKAYQTNNPMVKAFLQRAYQEFPNSINDTEATLALLAKDKQEEDKVDAETSRWMEKAKEKIDDQQNKMNDMAQVIIDQEKRFQDFNKEVAKLDLSPTDQAKAAVQFAKDTKQAPGTILQKFDTPDAKEKKAKKSKPPVDLDITEPQVTEPAKAPAKAPAQVKKAKPAKTAPAPAPQSDKVIQFEPRKKKSAIDPFAPGDDMPAQKLGEATQEGSPTTGRLNYEIIRKAFLAHQPKVDLEFGEKRVTIWANQMYGIGIMLTLLAKGDRAKIYQLAEVHLSDYESFLDFVTLKNTQHYIAEYPEYIQQKQRLAKKTIKKDPQGQMSLNLKETGNTNMSDTQKLMEKYMGFKKTVASIEKGGSAKDPEAVAAAIGREKYGKAKFQKAAAAGKKLGEGSKPDFLDLDKDGDKKEPMKKAAKDKKEITERELKNKEAFDKDAKPGDYYKTSKGNKVIKTKTGVRHEKGYKSDDSDKDDLDESVSRKHFRQVADLLQNIENKDKRKELAHHHAGIFAKQNPRFDKSKFLKAAGVGDELDEVAPPGAKAERMVKHIKKGYAKDGELTQKEKGIAYATAWKAKKAGKVEEATEFGDTIKNSKAELKKAKPAKLKESADIRNHPIYTTQEAWEHYSKELAEQEAVENVTMEEENLYDATQELDEIAALAGLARAAAPALGSLARAAAPAVAATATNRVMDKVLGDDTVDEGNEFTKARLDAIKSGKDTFTVGGKVYSVSGDTSSEKAQVAEGIEECGHDMDEPTGGVNVSTQADSRGNKSVTITADGKMAKQLIDMLRLAGVDSPEEHPAVIALQQEERDIEYDNTPDEVVAPVDAVTTDAGGGENRPKKQYPFAANKGANPIEEQADKKVQESLWKKYEDMLKDVKA